MGVLSKIHNYNALVNDTITNVFSNRDGIDHESESKDPPQNNSVQWALSQNSSSSSNCNAMKDDGTGSVRR